MKTNYFLQSNDQRCPYNNDSICFTPPPSPDFDQARATNLGLCVEVAPELYAPDRFFEDELRSVSAEAAPVSVVIVSLINIHFITLWIKQT
jgi:hypothetical protein